MIETIGRYTLVRQLAQGGMGDVHLARVTGAAGFSRPAVIKRVRPELRERGDAVGMFLDEARLSAQLNHPHIVQVFDLGETADGFYMAMEFVDGVHLGKLMRTALIARRPLSVPLCVFICARVAEALHYAHHARNLTTGETLLVVHRDVSPSNILISRGGDVKLTDFGVAKARTQQVKTALGYVKGKVAYLSPEQVELQKIDGRSDVFSLGIVLWELLARMRLYREPDEFVAMDRIVKEPTPSPLDYQARIPTDVVAIVMQALEKAPGDRYVTAGAFQDALDGWLRNHGVYHGRQDLSAELSVLNTELGFDQVSAATEVVRVKPAPAATHDSERERAGIETVEAGVPNKRGDRPAPPPPTTSPPSDADEKTGYEDREKTQSKDAEGDDADKTIDLGSAAAQAQAGAGLLAANAATQIRSLVERKQASGPLSEFSKLTATPSASRTQLPSFETPFVGRQAELKLLRQHLLVGVRALVLCGPEGIGKTRLAVEFCRRLHDPSTIEDERLAAFRIFFCRLGPAKTLAELIERLARDVGLALAPNHDGARAFSAIGQRLAGSGPALLVLDHPGAAEENTNRWREEIAALLAAAPQLHLLLTARAPPPIEDAVSIDLRPLRQNTSAATKGSANAGVGFDAVDLFVQRMRTLRPSYVLTEKDTATVNRIVARLGGNPMAIEIAAGQVAGADVAGLLDRMDDRPEIQSTDSVAAVLDLGLETLSAAEQEALLQSAVFPRQMAAVAARAVLKLKAGVSIDATLEQLASRSLLRREREVLAGVRSERYRLAEGVRARATTMLQKWSGRGALEGRFDAYHLEAGEEWAASCHGPLGAGARATLARERPNLIAVAERALADGAGQATADQALRAVLVLDAHFALAGPVHQQLDFLDRAADVSSSRAAEDPALVVRLTIARGHARHLRGWLQEAIAALKDASLRAQQLGRADLEALALYHLAAPRRLLADRAETTALLERALTLAQAAKKPGLEGRILATLGALRLDAADAAGALRLLGHALRHVQDTGDLHAEAQATLDLARAEVQQGGGQQGRGQQGGGQQGGGQQGGGQGGTIQGAANAERALHLFSELGDRRGEAEALLFLAQERAEAGAEEALLAFARALELARGTSDQRLEGLVLSGLGSIRAARRDLRGARQDLDAARALLSSLGLKPLLLVVDLDGCVLEILETEASATGSRREAVQRTHELLAQALPPFARAAEQRLRATLTRLRSHGHD